MTTADRMAALAKGLWAHGFEGPVMDDTDKEQFEGGILTPGGRVDVYRLPSGYRVLQTRNAFDHAEAISFASKYLADRGFTVATDAEVEIKAERGYDR